MSSKRPNITERFDIDTDQFTNIADKHSKSRPLLGRIITQKGGILKNKISSITLSKVDQK